MTGIVVAVPLCISWKKKPQKLTQLSSRSHQRHLLGKRTAQKRHHHRHHKRQPANFDDFEMPVIVDYSTNVGEVVYTLINQNDPVDVEIEDNPYFELNPSNDHEVIVKACLPTTLLQQTGFRVVGETSYCAFKTFGTGPATPVFTNPSNVVLSITLPSVLTVLFHVTLDNDVCGSFTCTTSCTNVPNMNPTYDSSSHEVRTFDLGLQYNFVYSVEVQCLDENKPSLITANHKMTVQVMISTSTRAPDTTTTTTTSLTTTTPTTTTTTTPTATTTTSTTTTTTPTATTTTPTTTSTSTTITTTPTTITSTRTTTLSTLTNTTFITPTTIMTTPTTTTTTPTTTMTTTTTTTSIPTTTTTTPTTSTITSRTTTPPTTTATTSTATIATTTSTLTTHTTTTTSTTTSITTTTTPTTIPTTSTTTPTTIMTGPTPLTTAHTTIPTSSRTTTTTNTPLTTTTPTTTTSATSTMTSFTTIPTILSTALTPSTTIQTPSMQNQSGSANALGSSGQDNPDTSTLNTPAIGAGAGLAGIAAAGLLAFTIYRKVAGAGSVLPGSGGRSSNNNNNDNESQAGSSESSTTNLISNSGGPRRPSLAPVEVNELDFV